MSKIYRLQISCSVKGGQLYATLPLLSFPDSAVRCYLGSKSQSQVRVSTIQSCFFQNLSVELQLESHAEFSHDNFKAQVDKAAGARYGTGVRDLWSNSQKNDLKRCFFKLTSSPIFRRKISQQIFLQVVDRPVKVIFLIRAKINRFGNLSFQSWSFGKKKSIYKNILSF